MSRPVPLLEQLAIGVIASAITLGAEADACPPEWIKVTPRGRQQCRDGRSFDFDPETLVRRFQSDGIDIPVDTDHSTVLLGAQGQTPRIVGYTGSLEARDDGLYAKPDWNEAGLATHKARTHKFVSPSVHPDANGRTVWLHSIALVPAPALSMPALFHTLPETSMQEIAKALGLPAASTEAACLAALSGRIDPKPLATALGLAETADSPACLAAIARLKAGDAGMVAELQTQIATMGTTIASMNKAARDKEVKELLDGALKDKRIVPAQRASLELMCASDEGLKHTREMIKNSPAQLQASGLDGKAPETGESDYDPVVLAAEARTIQDEHTKSGTPINFSDAMGLLMAKKAKG